MKNVWKWSWYAFPEGLVPGPGSATDASTAYENVLRVKKDVKVRHCVVRMMQEVASLDAATRTAMATYLPMKELTKVSAGLFETRFSPASQRTWEELGPTAALLARAQTESVPPSTLLPALAHAGSSVWAARWVASTGLVKDNLEELLLKANRYGDHPMYVYWWRLRAAHRMLLAREQERLLAYYGADLAPAWIDWLNSTKKPLARVTLPGIAQATEGVHVVLKEIAELQLGHGSDLEQCPSEAKFDVVDVCGEPSVESASHVALALALNTALGRDVPRWEEFISRMGREGAWAAAVKTGVVVA